MTRFPRAHWALCLLLPRLATGCGEPPGTTDPGDAASSTAASSSGADGDGASSSDDTGASVPTGTTTGAASDEGSSSGGGDSTTSAVPMPASCEGITPTTLYATTEHIGAPADVFLLALLSWWNRDSGDYDESADEFVVPDGACWCISSVSIAWIMSGQAPAEPELVVNFYDDADSLPGERWFSETTTAVTVGSFDAGNHRYDIELAEPVMAPAGRTWMSVVAVMQDTERMGWRLSMDADDTPSAAHLDKMDCPEFVHYEDCYPGEPPVQLAFEIHGAEIACTGE